MSLQADLDGLAGRRFLVVDDEAFMRGMIVRILARIGCSEVATAESGADALSVMAGPDGPPDVVLCDLNMPGMDGVEFLRHLAALPFIGAIVLISGEDRRVLRTAQDLAEIHALNVLGAIGKPVTPAALSAVLARHDISVPRPALRPEGAMATAAEVATALDTDQLVPYFQPKVALATRRLVGVETLVRWSHPERGIVAPDRFVPVAEQAGLIGRLTDDIFAKAMANAGRWRVDGIDLKISVNVSADSLTDLTLPDRLAERAVAHGVEPTRIMLEVTESRLMADVARTLETLTRLRLKGIGLSIDDFGTGYSSMEQLRRVPFVELKIDRAFVAGATHDADARAMLESSIDLARKLDLSIVAEGAESEEDMNLVTALGCDEVQGYFVARPMPAHDLLAWIERWNADRADR
ncbi:MAG: EAL domain-containing protein [Alphaproteobacteria bacterium]